MNTNYLILVNTAHRIPAEYSSGVELVEMRGCDDEIFRVEINAAAQFRALQKAAAQAGIGILLSSAYRSIERQREIREEFLEEYGEDYVRRFVAEPGCSEHHTASFYQNNINKLRLFRGVAFSNATPHFV